MGYPVSARKTGPLEMKCPYCGAMPGEECRRIERGTVLYYYRGPHNFHAARAKAAERGEK